MEYTHLNNHRAIRTAQQTTYTHCTCPYQCQAYPLPPEIISNSKQRRMMLALPGSVFYVTWFPISLPQVSLEPLTGIFCSTNVVQCQINRLNTHLTIEVAMKAIQIQSAGKITFLDNVPIPEPKEGEILVFGMPHHTMQQFPWYHVFRHEVKVVTSVGPECGEYFQIAADMIVDGRSSVLRDMLQPRMKWAEARKAFELYASCAEDILKLTLDV